MAAGLHLTGRHIAWHETGELVAAVTVAWTPDGRGLVYLVREDGDSAASWTIRSIDATGGSRSSVLIQGVQSFDIGRPGP